MKLRDLFAFEIVRYGMVSIVALAVDFGVLILLNEHLGIHYRIAATISFVTGGVVAYFLSVRFVFAQHRMQIHTFEAMAFVALGLVGLAVNTVVMGVAVGRMGATVVVAKAVSACCTFGVNFLLRKVILFTVGPTAAGNAESR